MPTSSEQKSAVQADPLSGEYINGLYGYAVVLTRNHAEAEDLGASMKQLDAQDVTRRWNLAMVELMEDVNGVAIDEVFHFFQGDILRRRLAARGSRQLAVR